ncbi:MAG: hypothetical protein KC442_14500, partial [Thermomicrobiales bacterium]|nr:hypothetical protein [Thermomicrobiales bacterium]
GTRSFDKLSMTPGGGAAITIQHFPRNAPLSAHNFSNTPGVVAAIVQVFPHWEPPLPHAVKE